MVRRRCRALGISCRCLQLLCLLLVAHVCCALLLRTALTKPRYHGHAPTVIILVVLVVVLVVVTWQLKRVKENLPATLKVIRPTDAIPIAKTAEKLAKVPPEVNVRLNTARKEVEKAATAEAYQKKLADMKAAAAAKKAAMGK